LHTVLDDARTWFLHGIVYQNDLRVIVTEGFLHDQTEELRIGEHVIKDTRRIDISEHSRMFVVRFTRPVAWQVVDESFTAWDDYEQRDDTGTLQTLSRSKYLDYVKGSHGWHEDTLGPAKHYRVWTENEVIDVIACEAPVVEPWTGSVSG
jgi:hypothetical protein